MNNDLPLVSLIIVVRNEIQYIEVATASLINQDYPREKLELIFVDGCSTDGTKQVLEEIVNRLKNSGYHDVKLIDNPKMILAAGWNLAIQAASGDIVCRIDAHSEIDQNYISNGVNILRAYLERNVVCVGGIISQNVGGDTFSNIVADLFSSRFGVGNSPFRNQQTQIIESDTAVFGLYWKLIFEEVGLFDETLERNQDIELHQRIRSRGMKFLTNPEMKIKYYVRNNLAKLRKKAYGDGYWIIRSGSRSLRHWVPLCFVLYIIVLPLFIFYNIYWALLPLLVYIMLSIGFGIKDGSSLRARHTLPWLFPVFHISYGWGTLRSLFNRTI